MGSGTDPITVLVLAVVSGQPMTPVLSDTLAIAVRKRIEALLTARREPLAATDIDRVEFDVATELMVLAVAMLARLPTVDLEELQDAIEHTIVELAALRDRRGRG